MAAGAWNGALATGLRIATLALSYGLAAVLGPVLAPTFSARLGGGDLIATVASGTVVFVVAYVGLGIAARFARRLGPRENVGRSPRDRFLGASFGAVRGALVAMMVVYLAMWFDALRTTGTAEVLPEIGDSVAADLTGGVVESVLASAVDTTDPGARFVTRFAARPAAAAGELQGILDDPSFVRLRNDTRFWNDIEDGNVQTALQRSSFAGLAENAQLRQKAALLGLVSDDAALDADAFRKSIAQVFEEIGPRLRGLRDDPAVKELLADPEVVAKLQSGDTIGLLAHAKFRELVARISTPPK
jgi:hypothetical protein